MPAARLTFSQGGLETELSPPATLWIDRAKARRLFDLYPNTEMIHQGRTSAFYLGPFLFRYVNTPDIVIDQTGSAL